MARFRDNVRSSLIGAVLGLALFGVCGLALIGLLSLIAEPSTDDDFDPVLSKPESPLYIVVHRDLIASMLPGLLVSISEMQSRVSEQNLASEYDVGVELRMATGRIIAAAVDKEFNTWASQQHGTETPDGLVADRLEMARLVSNVVSSLHELPRHYWHDVRLGEEDTVTQTRMATEVMRIIDAELNSWLNRPRPELPPSPRPGHHPSLGPMPDLAQLKLGLSFAEVERLLVVEWFPTDKQEHEGVGYSKYSFEIEPDKWLTTIFRDDVLMVWDWEGVWGSDATVAKESFQSYAATDHVVVDMHGTIVGDMLNLRIHDDLLLAYLVMRIFSGDDMWVYRHSSMAGGKILRIPLNRFRWQGYKFNPYTRVVDYVIITATELTGDYVAQDDLVLMRYAFHP